MLSESPRRTIPATFEATAGHVGLGASDVSQLGCDGAVHARVQRAFDRVLERLGS
jgi:hypothetical protein